MDRGTNTWFLIVVAIALVAYARSFDGVFQFDDHLQILRRPVLMQDSTWSDYLHWARTRLIPLSTLALNHRLSGESPFWYHVVNFVIHVLTCFVLYRLALALCRTPSLRTTWLAERAHVFALAAAILFASHPIQVQAVTYIVQRISSMAGLFYLSAVLAYVRCRIFETTSDPGNPRRAYTAAVGFAVAASLSKENAASLPLAILLAEWVFFRGGLRMIFVRRWLPFLLLALAMPIVFGVLDRRPAPPDPPQAAAINTGAPHQAATPGAPTAAGEHRQGPRKAVPVIVRGEELAATLQRAASATAISPRSYFLTQCRVVPRYLRLVLLPIGLTIDHDIPLEDHLSPPVLAGLGLLLGLIGFGLYAVRRWPLLGFGILWFFIAHSVESTIIPIGDVMNEHRMYLAMPGIAFVAAFAFAYWQRRAPRPALIGGILVVVVLTLLTMQRNEVWRTQMGLWQDALAKSPGKTRVHMNVATSFFAEGNYQAAIDHYCEVLRIDPKDRFAPGYIQLALSALMDSEDAKIEFELANTGPDGTMELMPRHPCPGGVRRE